VADLGKGPGTPLILGKKKNIAEVRKAGRASKKKTPPSPAPLVQGLVPPLNTPYPTTLHMTSGSEI